MGKLMRSLIAPNNLSIADPDAVQPVYGHGNGTVKSVFYDAYGLPLPFL